ncbi:MAG TPA: hypothetical protein VGC40_09040 [Paenirhodobacter sp.]
MHYLIWAGVAISILGLCGIMASVMTILRARRAGLSDADLRAKLKQSMLVNLAAMGVSMIGLMMVVVGVLLA